MTSDVSEVLLPCPFCGSGARFVKHSAGVRGTMAFDSWDAVACAGCGATVGACDRRFRNKDDARKAWNTRAQPAVLAVPGWRPIESAPKDGSDVILSNGYWAFEATSQPDGTFIRTKDRRQTAPSNCIWWQPFPKGKFEGGNRSGG